MSGVKEVYAETWGDPLHSQRHLYCDEARCG